MARSNKYNSLNFNDIYEKKKKINTNNNNNSTRSNSSSSSSSSNKTLLSNSRIHGNMLVLTRPSPKPIVPPPPPPPATTQPPPPNQPPVEPDSISLRPLGRTGLVPHNLTFPRGIDSKDSAVSAKTNRFVPPHLRPGFHGREEKPEPEAQKQTGFGMRSSNNIRQGLLGAPVRNGEEGRPKSGGGFEGNRMFMNRPGSSGSARPYSSG